MSSPAEETQSWSRLRWGVGIAAVVALHFVLLGAVGNSPARRIEHKPPTEMVLPESVAAELQSLTDPTLLALGGPHGFSSIWMVPTNPPPINEKWEPADKWREIEPSHLGNSFVEFARKSAAPLHGLTFKVAPQPYAADSINTAEQLRRASTLRVTGDLTDRKVLNPPTLPPQIGSDLLNSSEVRVVVDPRGIVTSAILLAPGSGSTQVDRFALEQALKLRFSPIRARVQPRSLALGTVIFDWLTVSSTAPNEPGQ